MDNWHARAAKSINLTACAFVAKMGKWTMWPFLTLIYSWCFCFYPASLELNVWALVGKGEEIIEVGQFLAAWSGGAELEV